MLCVTNKIQTSSINVIHQLDGEIIVNLIHLALLSQLDTMTINA